MSKLNLTENKTKSLKFSVACINCNVITKHTVLTSIELEGEDFEDGDHWSTGWNSHYQIIRCGGCESISFRETNWCSEWADTNTGDSGEKEFLYPERNLKALSVKDYLYLPYKLEKIYGEVIDCFNSKNKTLCAAGLRAIVEGICAEKEIKGGLVEENSNGNLKSNFKNDLRGKIAGLKQNALITQSSFDLLNELRFIGNEAIHELERPSKEELSIAIGIIEHTLEHLYEQPKIAEKLMEIRAIKKSKKSH